MGLILWLTLWKTHTLYRKASCTLSPLPIIRSTITLVVPYSSGSSLLFGHLVAFLFPQVRISYIYHYILQIFISSLNWHCILLCLLLSIFRLVFFGFKEYFEDIVLRERSWNKRVDTIWYYICEVLEHAKLRLKKSEQWLSCWLGLGVWKTRVIAG